MCCSCVREHENIPGRVSMLQVYVATYKRTVISHIPQVTRIDRISRLWIFSKGGNRVESSVACSVLLVIGTIKKQRFPARSLIKILAKYLYKLQFN